MWWFVAWVVVVAMAWAMMVPWQCLVTTQSRNRTTPPTTMTATVAPRGGCTRGFCHIGSCECVRTPTVRRNATGYVWHMRAHTYTHSHIVHSHAHVRTHKHMRPSRNDWVARVWWSWTCVSHGMNVCFTLAINVCVTWYERVFYMVWTCVSSHWLSTCVSHGMNVCFTLTINVCFTWYERVFHMISRFPTFEITVPNMKYCLELREVIYTASTIGHWWRGRLERVETHISQFIDCLLYMNPPQEGHMRVLGVGHGSIGRWQVFVRSRSCVVAIWNSLPRVQWQLSVVG